MLNSVTAQFVATRFSIVGSDTVSKFHRGVMPQDPEADQQFTLVISMLLNTLRTQMRPFCLPGATRLRLGTWTFQTLTTLTSPSPCMPTRSTKTLRSTILVLRRVFRLPQPDGPRHLSWCDFATNSTRRWKHMIKALVRSHVPQDAWDQDSPHLCGVPLHTDIQLHWPCYECGLSFASNRALMAQATAAHAAVSFASRFNFDVYCTCCLTLLSYQTEGA